MAELRIARNVDVIRAGIFQWKANELAAALDGWLIVQFIAHVIPPIVNLGARLPAATDRPLLQWGHHRQPMGCLFQRFGPGINSAFLRLRPSTSPLRSAFSSSVLIAIDNEYSSLKSAGGRRQTCTYDEVAQQKTAPPP